MVKIDALTRIWDGFRGGTHPRQLEADAAGDPHALFYLAILVFSYGDPDAAARLAAMASVARPDDLVYRAATHHLRRLRGGSRRDVYAAPEGFAAFIRGGGNVALYAALVATLRERYRRHRPASLLDIGTGDGLAL